MCVLMSFKRGALFGVRKNGMCMWVWVWVWVWVWLCVCVCVRNMMF